MTQHAGFILAGQDLLILLVFQHISGLIPTVDGQEKVMGRAYGLAWTGVVSSGLGESSRRDLTLTTALRPTPPSSSC